MALALPLLPILGGGGLLLLRRRPHRVALVAVTVVLVTLALGLWAAFSEPSMSWRWSPRIELSLAVTGFTRVMVVLVPLIAAPVMAYAAATEREGRVRLLGLLLTFVGAMLLLVSAADFVTLLIAWELVGFISWALIAHRWRDPIAVRSAAQAFVTTQLGDIGLYVAAGVAFAATGSFAFADLHRADATLLAVIGGGVLLAAAAKSAQLPFSPWLFAAMAGPTPVSALLHSATMVAAGAYLLIRLAPTLAPIPWFLPSVAAVGLATALAGGLVATLQTDAKRTLAASTSAQYGLMFVAVGAGSVAASGAQLVTHAAFKALLFLGAGIAIHAAGTGRLARLHLGMALPRVALLSGLAALALAALPPLGGAWTKEQILAAAVTASPWLGVGVVAAGFLTALYAARYQLLAFGALRPLDNANRDSLNPRDGVGRTELASLAALASLTLLLSALWLPAAHGLVEAAAPGRLPAGADWELVVGVAAIVLAFALAWWLLHRGLLGTLGLPGARQAAAADWLGLPTATRALVVGPVLALSRTLAQFDDHVVDAGVRGVARLARRGAALVSLRGEWTFDGAVRALSVLTLGAARASRLGDELGIDAAAEGSARSIGLAGRASRRLQTGQTQHYYVILALGVLLMLALLAMAR